MNVYHPLDPFQRSQQDLPVDIAGWLQDRLRTCVTPTAWPEPETARPPGSMIVDLPPVQKRGIMAVPADYPRLPRTGFHVSLDAQEMSLSVTDTATTRHEFLAACEALWAKWEKVNELDS